MIRKLSANAVIQRFTSEAGACVLVGNIQIEPNTNSQTFLNLNEK